MDKNLVLGDYRRWLLAVANRMITSARADVDYEGRVQELAQEGYIAMWRALDTYDPDKGAMPSWLTRAAEMRMRDVMGKGQRFGHIRSTNGNTHATKRRPGDTRPVATGEDHLDSLSPGDLDRLEQKIAVWLEDGLALAYHRGAIQRAIGRLTPDEQRYVVLRFWHGKTNPEIDPHVEGNVVHIWRTARGKLAQDLRKLAPGG